MNRLQLGLGTVNFVGPYFCVTRVALCKGVIHVALSLGQRRLGFCNHRGVLGSIRLQLKSQVILVQADVLLLSLDQVLKSFGLLVDAIYHCLGSSTGHQGVLAGF